MNRRDALKTSSVAALSLLAAKTGWSSEEGSRQQIGVAGYAYDRVQAIRDGQVGIDNFDINFSVENIYRMNELAFGPDSAYEVTEVGLIPYITRFINDGFRDYTLIPVFISRTFRHRNLYVHVDSGIEKPEDLRGRRIGTPGYGSSANTWGRGLLQDQYGIAAGDMHWIEATKSSDIKGAVSTSSGTGSRYQLPDDFPLVSGPPGVDESDLLLGGHCDALLTPITPRAFAEGDPRIRQLFPNLKSAEQAYFKETGLFPIMHVIAVRADVAEALPDLPAAIFQMFNEAKQIAYENLATTTVLRTSLPWVTEEYEETQRLMGADYWRYGAEANRKELEAVMRYTYEQGLVKRHADFEEMFHPGTLDPEVA